MISLRYSFKLLSKKDLVNLSENKGGTSTAEKINTKSEKVSEETSDGKRAFLKVAGIAGVGLVASQLLPNKAEALIMGSTPSSNLVGIKNSSNTRIDPATESTLASIKSQSDLLTFDSGSNPANLKVNIAAGDVGLQNAANVVINPATEDTLALIKSQTDKFTFSGSSLLTAGGSAASVVGLNDSTNTQINPASDDAIVYLRRMVKLMESQAVVDGANRQRVNIDGFGTNGALVTGTGVSGAGIPRVTVSNDSVVALAAGAQVVGSIANIATLAGQNHQMYQDVARNSYANGIRNNLAFN